MKKIKITEKQAKLLGLNKVTENEESGVKSVATALGDVIIRIVVYGDAVPKYKDRIIQLITRQDKDARVGFFEQTSKVVGNVKEIKLDSIKRDIKALDPTIMVEKKPIAKSLKEDIKNIVKITQEQYDRLFVNKGIVENEITGGLNRVDKTFKKGFAGKNVQNLKPTPVSEDKFNITKPNKSVPKLTTEGDESEAEDPLKAETLELIKYLYRKNEKLSPYWEQNGLSYDAICDTLLAKKLIVKNGGRYELAKKLGSPQVAIQAVEDALRTHIKPQVEEPELETEDSGYPAGVEQDSAAPFNKKDDTTAPIQAKQAQLKPIAFNREIILFKAPDGAMYVFYHDNLDKNSLKDYASITRHYVGKDEEGHPQYDYDNDFEVDADVISNYVNDNLDSLTKGEGLEAYEQGAQLVMVDDSLKQELLSLYDKDKNLVKVLNPIDEVEFPEAMGAFKDSVKQNVAPKGSLNQPTPNPKPEQHAIVTKLAQLKANELARRKAASDADDKILSDLTGVKEMTGTGSAGAFTAPMGDVLKKEMPTTPVVGEGRPSILGKGYTHFALLKSNNKIVDGWDYKGKETDEIKYWSKIDLNNNFPDNKTNDFKVVSRQFLVKNNIDPTDTNYWLKTFDSTLDEASTVASTGNFQYDTPGGLTMDLGKSNPKTKAEKTPQWAGGSFVKQPECSKLNNNKSAQNGGCNQGASSLKTVKASGSINAPSLGENEIYETIAKKTGKTLDEVKRIIDSKKTKA